MLTFAFGLSFELFGPVVPRDLGIGSTGVH
jgi:hypothetical protein